MTNTEASRPESVSVEISGCSPDDARVVFDTLSACFASDRDAGDAPRQQDESRPMVWLGTYDIADAHTGNCPPARLSSSVQADVQGGYWAVDRFRAALDEMFTVQETAAASGDQERELHLLLGSR
ncbi:hypothetical protein ACFWN1_15615 [Streptomyces sp. NPDC058459]|uniref:hypothetical protein n=1 Tax=Streptomyces sp. NPDC058459 TaxID=3346508 RepID=UPI0036594973